MGMTILFLVSPTFAEEPALRIGRILIDRKNVFESGDPSDKRFPYSWANALHIVTRERFVRDTLLFKEGEVYDELSVSESERLLRRYEIFRYAHIEPQPPLNGVVDILVKTEDVWSTSIEMSYGTAGGKNFYQLGVFEQNLFGTGARAGAFTRQDIDRHRSNLSYFDPHVFHNRWELFGGYGKDEKGKQWEGRLERPFYSALVRHSEGAAVEISEDQDRLFERGDEVSRFYHKEWMQRVYAAYAARPSLMKVRRPSLIFEADRHEFSQFELLATVRPPVDKTMNTVLAGYEHRTNRFIKERGVTTFDRDEDINMGWEFYGEAGPYRTALGSTRNGALVRGRAQKIVDIGGRRYWLNELIATGRHEDGRIANGIFRYHTSITKVEWVEGHTATFRSELAMGKNLDVETQFLLGGENGLRGYSVRQFGGQKKWLLSAEDRQVICYDWLRLVNIGWAMFADTGAVWKEKQALRQRDFRSDVGLGLRLAPSRSTNPGLIRMDLAYALEDNERSSRFVVNIGADFSFNLRKEKKFDQ
jgi:hypothetical protein